MDDAVEPGDEAGDAARAFENLRAEILDQRAEILVMRQDIAALPHLLAADQPPPPVDYRSDIGKVTQGLGVVVSRLDVIEKHPALRLTPEQHRQAMAIAGTQLMRDAAGKLDNAARDHAQASGQLAQMIGTIRQQGSQRNWLIYTGLVAFVVGMVLSPFFASALPFGLDGQVAALIMKNDRWDAGWALLRADDVAAANDAANGFNLFRANRDALVACQQAAEQAGRDQKCQIIVKVSGGQ